MPLPKPKKGESKNDFVSRCLGSEAIKEFGKENKQRVAVCESQWERRNDRANEGGESVADNDRRYLVVNAKTKSDEARTETFNGREYRVVPVVALVEGVIWPSNAPSAELALASEFGYAVGGWNGRPVVMNHPEDEEGVKISANSPKVLESHQLGYLFNSGMNDKKLTSEIWLDVERCNTLGGAAAEVVTRLDNKETLEVSTGLFMKLEDKKGVFNGSRYNGVWKQIVPDHLAILPKGMTGACSIADGCGAPRVNAAAAKPDGRVLSALKVFAEALGLKTSDWDPEDPLDVGSSCGGDCGCDECALERESVALAVNAKDPKKPYGDVEYADPGYQKDGKHRYPVDTKEHADTAWKYINMPKNEKKYSSGDLAKVKAKIKKACKKFGIEISDSGSGDPGELGDADLVAEVAGPKVCLSCGATGKGATCSSCGGAMVLGFTAKYPTSTNARVAAVNEALRAMHDAHAKAREVGEEQARFFTEWYAENAKDQISAEDKKVALTGALEDEIAAKRETGVLDEWFWSFQSVVATFDSYFVYYDSKEGGLLKRDYSVKADNTVKLGDMITAVNPVTQYVETSSPVAAQQEDRMAEATNKVKEQLITKLRASAGGNLIPAEDDAGLLALDEKQLEAMAAVEPTPKTLAQAKHLRASGLSTLSEHSLARVLTVAKEAASTELTAAAGDKKPNGKDAKAGQNGKDMDEEDDKKEKPKANAGEEKKARTIEEFLAPENTDIPSDIREILGNSYRAQQAKKSEMIKNIRANTNNAWTEDELKAMSAENLEKIAALAVQPVTHARPFPNNQNPREEGLSANGTVPVRKIFERPKAPTDKAA